MVVLAAGPAVRGDNSPAGGLASAAFIISMLTCNPTLFSYAENKRTRRPAAYSHQTTRKTSLSVKELPAGESFVFINDHDPKPLYYEFRSIYGDVVGWDYLQRDPAEWKVKVTRTEASKGREFEGASTVMDLRRAEKKDWKYAVFHRYGMMLKGDTMELLAVEDPVEIRSIFEKKFTGEFTWEVKKEQE